MGKIYEYNWALILKPWPENLEENKIYDFEKTEERIYPRGMPIILSNAEHKDLGKCEIIEFTISENKTSGKYKVLKLT